MPGPILPAVVAGGLTVARGARSLYKTGKAAKSALRKDLKDFNEYMPQMIPSTAGVATYAAADTLSGGKLSDFKKRPNTIVRGRSSNPSDFSRKLIK